VIDVAIVGGGPAGLLTALRLAQSGLDVVLFEEHPRIGDPVHCTGIVSQEIAELVKIPDDVVLGRLRRARLFGPNAACADIEWAGRDGEEIIVIDRGEFDRRLAQQATGAGATVLTGQRVDEIVPIACGVELRVSSSAVKARVCVIACGVSYRFQRQLGLGLPGRIFHTAQVEIAGQCDDRVELHFGRTIAPAGFLWTVPITRAGVPRTKVGVMARGDAGKHLQTFFEDPKTRARLGVGDTGVVRRILPLRPLDKTYADRMLVVGDAGGFTKPTTGGGIFYSLVTASLAADTLLEAFAAQRFEAKFLARYERAWRARIGYDVRTGDWLRSLVAECTDSQITALVQALGQPGVQPLIGRFARFNWHQDVIHALLRRRVIASVVFRSLFP
jgi:digeranylgeranylglycerophospholipid reductase